MLEKKENVEVKIEISKQPKNKPPSAKVLGLRSNNKPVIYWYILQQNNGYIINFFIAIKSKKKYYGNNLIQNQQNLSYSFDQQNLSYSFGIKLSRETV